MGDMKNNPFAKMGSGGGEDGANEPQADESGEMNSKLELIRKEMAKLK
jgi:hypothetical protein